MNKVSFQNGIMKEKYTVYSCFLSGEIMLVKTASKFTH